MKLCIVWEREDGGISITHPAPNYRLEGETDEQLAARVAAKDVPAGRPAHIQKNEDLPKSRRLRNAWRRAGNAIAIDGPSARAIVLAEVRLERDRRLIESDKEKSRLDDVGNGQEKAAIKEYRQKLRDLPAVVAATIELLPVADLEAFQPTWP